MGVKHLSICFVAGEDEEMEHQEVARPNQDIFIEPGNCQSEGSVREEDCEDPENVSIAGIQKTSAKSANCPAKLFTFSMVNSYGTADISSLTSDNTVLKLNGKNHSGYNSGVVVLYCQT